MVNNNQMITVFYLMFVFLRCCRFGVVPDKDTWDY